MILPKNDYGRSINKAILCFNNHILLIFDVFGKKYLLFEADTDSYQKKADTGRYRC